MQDPAQPSESDSDLGPAPAPGPVPGPSSGRPNPAERSRGGIPGMWVSGVAAALGLIVFLSGGEDRRIGADRNPAVAPVPRREGRVADSTPAPAEAPAELTFLSTPAGAEVEMGGKRLGCTPLRDVPVAPGEVVVSFQLPGHAGTHVTRLVQAGSRETLSVDLAALPSRLALFSDPPGARVTVDGRDSARVTPCALELPAGSHAIGLHLDGHQEWAETLRTEGGVEHRPPLVRLEKSGVPFRVETSPAGAAVSLDGRFVGISPVDAVLAGGAAVDILVTLEGHAPHRERLARDGGGPASHRITLHPVRLEVDIRSEPSGAAVWLNGAMSGVTPVRVTVNGTRQQLRLTKPGWDELKADWNPAPHAATPAHFVLTRSAAAAPETPAAVSAGAPVQARCPAGSMLRLIQPRTFTMGESGETTGASVMEIARTVQFRHAYYLGEREVTNREFLLFQPSHDSGNRGEFSLAGPEQPAVRVRWEDAALYCNWLSRREGLEPAYLETNGVVRAVDQARVNGYRLPSEAEWEYAARLGNGEATQRYPWGDAFPPYQSQANLADMMARDIGLPLRLDNLNDTHAVSAPVGSFEPNKPGLWDMAGNVSEWCHDAFEPRARGILPGDPQPDGDRVVLKRVFKGSSYAHARIREARCAYRGGSAAPSDDLGFRICRTAFQPR